MSDVSESSGIDLFRSKLVKNAQFSVNCGFPLLKKVYFKPTQAIPFEKASKTTKYDQWVHFYTFDRQFECVWKDPFRYLPVLKRFEGIITPDYSLGCDMPRAMQIWNTYRNRALGYWLQNEGVNIVPNVRWYDERTYDFAFEGLQTGGTVAVSTLGVIRNKYDRYLFQKGLNKMVETIEPEMIICHGKAPEEIFNQLQAGGIEIIVIPSHIDSVHSVKRGV